MTSMKALVVLGVISIFAHTAAWRGNIQRKVTTIYVTRRVCAYQTWAACCSYRTVREPKLKTTYSCADGWTHNGNENCNIPICNPSCANGGTCTRPNSCSCRGRYSGPTCQGQLCSHIKPCYPGTCSMSPRGDSICSCHPGFQTISSGCRTLLELYQKPEIRQYRIRFAEYNALMNVEKYGLLLDSDSTANEMWTNRNPFNQIYYTGVAFYSPENLPPIPSEYIRNAKLGIVGGKFEIDLVKATGRKVKTEPVNCKQTGVSVGIFNCSEYSDYDFRFDNGDNITIKFTVEAGGYRELIFYNSNTLYSNQSFGGTSATKSVKFKFDFERPEHCFPKCTQGETPLDFGGDIKTTPQLNTRWEGWTDRLSGVLRYAVEVFKLTANGDGMLLEPKPLEPLKITEIMHSDNIAYPSFTLPEPGLYSVILQIADKANNSQYVRRFCLYDPNSNIETTYDIRSRLRVSTAEPVTNFTWQSDINGEISVNWTDFFYNPFLENNRLLNEILDYPVQFIGEGESEEKIVAASYKNKEGRNESAVPNKRGVTKFEVAYHVDSNGGKNVDVNTLTWKNESLNTTYKLDRTVNNGNTLVILVKATDPIGNVLVEQTQVNFDSSKPTVEKVTLDQTTEEQVSLFVLAVDEESGILHVEWRLIRIDNQQEYGRGALNWPTLKKCDSVLECMCIQRFDICLPRQNTFLLKKIDLGFDEYFEGELQIMVKNRALLSGGDGVYKFTVKGNRPIESDGLSGGAIAGIIIFVLLALIIAAVLLFLFVTHRKPFNKDRRPAYQAEGQTGSPPAAFHNNAYVDDDLYLYGGMDFISGQSWQIPHSQLTLLGPITIGKFAKISQAKVKCRQEMVVAKMLKDNYNDDDILLIKAKVNYLATVVGQNPNILEFIGAVIDNDILGPVIISEYCEVGQLDKWLQTQRVNVSTEVTEKLQRIAFGVCKGMTYLASKKIVHKKLAARNVLLTFTLEAKITGFGPSKINDEADKERIPIKWTAPECIASLRNANEKSDAWSFGVVLWEIFSLGETPYSDIRSREVEDRLRNGYRMSMPEYCDVLYHGIIKDCWEDNPKKRPRFKKMSEKISSTFFAKTGDDFYYYS